MKTNGFTGWLRENTAITRQSLNLWRDCWLHCAAYGAVLVMLPYLLICTLTLSAVGFDTARGMAALVGILTGTATWSQNITGRMQALSSLYSIVSLVSSLLLVPLAYAAWAYIFAGRWQGLKYDLRRSFDTIKGRLMSAIGVGLVVMMAANLFQLVVGLLQNLVGILGSALSAIPVVGVPIYWLSLAIVLLLSLAVTLLSHAIIMFAMLPMLSENIPGRMAANQVLKLLWGGRRSVLPQLVWLLLCWGVALGVSALIMYLTAAVLPIWLITAVLAAALLCVGLPISAAQLTVIYMNESSRQGGRTYVYVES